MVFASYRVVLVCGQHVFYWNKLSMMFGSKAAVFLIDRIRFACFLNVWLLLQDNLLHRIRGVIVGSSCSWRCEHRVQRHLAGILTHARLHLSLAYLGDLRIQVWFIPEQRCRRPVVWVVQILVQLLTHATSSPSFYKWTFIFLNNIHFHKFFF